MKTGFCLALSLFLVALFLLRQTNLLPWRIVDSMELNAMQNELTRYHDQEVANRSSYVARGSWMWNRQPGALDRGPYHQY